MRRGTAPRWRSSTSWGALPGEPIHPFRIVDTIVGEARARTPVVLIDFHAEATSEKVAIARHLDGPVTAVIGTHTHVQTNDARVAARRDRVDHRRGMTGPHDSVIGVRAELAIQRMKTGMPVRFHPAEGDVRIEGVVPRLRRRRARYALRGAAGLRSTRSEARPPAQQRAPTSSRFPHEHEPADPG